MKLHKKINDIIKKNNFSENDVALNNPSENSQRNKFQEKIIKKRKKQKEKSPGCI